jgi:hypothetical protein
MDNPINLFKTSEGQKKSFFDLKACVIQPVK